MCVYMVSLVVWMVKNPHAMRETWVWSLVREDPLEKGMTIHPVFLPSESQGQRSLVGYIKSMVAKSRT